MDVEEKRSTSLSKSSILIIVVASVERFAYKGVASNMVTYLTDVVKLSTSSAAKSVSSWSGVTLMLPLISAVLTDSYWNRYSAIVASSMLYIGGLLGLTLWTILFSHMPTSSLFIPLYLISVGQAGYNPSLQAFGADQLELDDDHHEESKTSRKKSLFFQWWYFGLCSGSLSGNSLMSYIQDTIGWGLGFAIPTSAMILSVICFLSCARFYVYKKHLNVSSPSNQNIVQATRVAIKNIINLKLGLRPRDDLHELELQEKPLKDDFNASKNSDTNFKENDETFTVAKKMLRLFPIWIMLLMFGVIFQQPLTFFTKQGMAMKHTFRSSFVIPPATLQSAITLSVILLMPLYDKLISPILSLITRSERGISVLQRMGIGMVLSILAMIVAAIVETKRLEFSKKEPEHEILSIFWLLPQYILVGISDVFTVVGMQEFFYTEVPSTMRTIGIALYLSVFGVGSLLSALLISVVEMFTGTDNSWFSDDMSEARLDKYYWFLALLALISFLTFVKLSRNYDHSNASTSDGQ
ncbi:uncharacterized protein A4U43_C03F31510 [Asparagus officinalis]|uniref:Major facilitator superfamily (MFS) profile domain-containing protein n=1 Tax=Asparagus officinalis TaxID=4686 RepID=A0A5P1FIK2_ASPOF|nr:protein NRT1/ PTR FAMILY 5.8-like [Asparagus officinalis]ONK76729.1 uncharacterized protein A4U43_C03F31510 [Asparagus officinalis]